jgi:phosphatidylglycerol lysyltransferase
MQTQHPKTLTSKHIDQILPYFKQYGDSCMAYSGLQEGLEYFFIENIGYISYLRYKHLLFAPRGRFIALANPICAKENVHFLLQQFIKANPSALFIQISREIAIILDQLGYAINQYGIETQMNIQDYDLKGKTKSSLRQWRNKCRREKVDIKELDLSQCNDLAEIKSLSKSWLKSKGNKTLSFLTRPFLYQHETDTRCFIARQHGKLIGITVFDPFYRDNKVVGYYHNIDRIADNAPHGVSPTLILEAMDIFRQEKVEILSLGMSPLYQLGAEFNYNKISRKVLRFAYKNMNFLYPMQGNANHKKKFAGEQQRVYFCSTKGNNLWEVFILMKATSVF